MAETDPNPLTLSLTRVLPGTPAEVFRWFTDPDRLTRWWGPRGFRIPALRVDARAGGGYRIEMQPPEGAAFAVTGAFRTVEPPARLAYSFRWEPPHPDDVENLVELALRDRGGTTDVSLRQGPFATEARRALHRDGWGESLDRLEEALRS